MSLISAGLVKSYIRAIIVAWEGGGHPSKDLGLGAVGGSRSDPRQARPVGVHLKTGLFAFLNPSGQELGSWAIPGTQRAAGGTTVEDYVAVGGSWV